MENVVETRQLTKSFGGFTAVDGVSLRVGKGEIYGFLGLNGAGKTTTIRMLLGMVVPTAGDSLLFGERVGSADRMLWNRVGYLVEIPYSYPELTVHENLEIVCRLRLKNDPREVDSIMELLKIAQYRDRQARHLSLGNAQRLGLAKALLHRPELLILDEPSNGLDPAGIAEIRELLKDLAANRGVTIFISSHILGEIARLATRIGIIHNGRLLQEIDADKLDTVRNRRLSVAVRDVTGALACLRSHGHETVAAGEGVIDVTDGRAIVAPERVNTILVNAGIPPAALTIEEEDLESYFLRIIAAEGERKAA